MADPTTPAVNPAPGDNSSAPVQTAPTVNSTLPAAAPGATTANTAAPIPPSGPVATSSMPASPTPVAGQDMSDQSKKPNMAVRVLSGLMGGKPTGYAQTDNGPVPVTRDWKPGELARHVVASAASLLAAGIGGEQAARNKRPFELAPGTSLGDIKQEQQQKDQMAAQKQFENQQNTSKLLLQQHQDAREQQDSMINKGKYDMAVKEFQLAHANDDLVSKEKRGELLSNLQDQNIKQAADYQRFLTMPGSQVMKDASGNELNFADGDEAKAYVHEHPEAIHGMTNGKSKFGVVVVANPITGATQLIDFPADRHESGLSLVGAKVDKNGEYVTDKDGNYVPDGSILGRDGKPTFLTETVTPDQVRAIKSKQITEEDVISQMHDREAQARLRDAEIRKYPALGLALDLSNAGSYSKMTDAQKNIARTFLLKQSAQADGYLKNAESNLLKVQQQAGLGQASDDEVAKAQKEYDDAKDDVADTNDKLNQVTGNTMGVRFANRALRDGKVFTQPWGQTDAEIQAAPIPDSEKEVAKTRIWNSLSPAQRGQVNPTPQTQQAAAAANQTNAPAAKPHGTPAQPPAQGQAYIYDPQGLAHSVPANMVDQYLANSQYKGWSK